MDFNNETTVLEENNPLEVKAPENMALGIVGALIGAIIGGASIVLINQLGYVASISGLILAICTLKGYELLAKGLSMKGVVICAVLMLLAPFAADWVNWSLEVLRTFPEYDLTFIDAGLIFFELLAQEPELLGEYVKNLGMLYLFVVMGGFITLKNAFKGK